MGMYTGLRGEVILNDLGVQLAQEGFEWSKSQNGIIAGFGLDHRAGFIPFGSHCYMPDSWGEQRSEVVGQLWAFSCSLKNYESTIQRFIAEVLPLIAADWQLEILYEEDDEPTKINSKEQK